MTSEIKDAIAKRNELRKTVAQNREEWIDACKTTSELVKKRKQETWKEHVETITHTTSSKKVWQTIRAMDGRRPPGRENEVLEVAGTTYVEDADKAEQFAKTYRSFSKLPVAKEDRVLRRYNRKHMKRKHGPAEESEQPLTCTELERELLARLRITKLLEKMTFRTNLSRTSDQKLRNCYYTSTIVAEKVKVYHQNGEQPSSSLSSKMAKIPNKQHPTARSP